MTLSLTEPLRQPILTGFRGAVRTAGLIGLGAVAIIASLGDVVARAPADAARFGEELVPPSAAYPFGTDALGRDVLSETLHGLSATATDALTAMLVAVFAGGFAGFVLARFPLRSGFAVRGLAAVLASVPALLLAAIAVSIWGHGFAPVAAGLAAAPVAFVRAFDRARLLNDSPHAEYARASGIPAATLLRRDLVYEFRDTFLATAARALAAVTITLATLSFLGFGAAAPRRDLGLIIAASRSFYLEAWWTVLFPALALLLFVLFARLAAALEEGERP